MFIHNTNKLTNAGMNPTCAVPAALELARACVLAMEHERAKLSTSRTGYEESVTFFIQHGRRAFELASYLEAQMRRHHQLQQQRVQGKVAAARTGRDFALWALSCLSDCLATADASHKEALKEQQLSLLQAWRLLFESAGHLKAETLDAETVGLVQEFDSLSRNWNDEISATLRDIQQGKVIRAAEREILEHKMVFKALREGDALMGENNRRAGMGNHWYISFPLPPKPTAFPAYPLPPSSFLSLERGEGFCMYSHSLLTKPLTPTCTPSPYRYTCPNGHIYTIGDCGGAMVEATCHECGAKIGGTDHRSAAGNAAATTFLDRVAERIQDDDEGEL